MATLDKPHVPIAEISPPVRQSEVLSVGRVLSWIIDKAAVLLILGFMMLPIIWVVLTSVKPVNTVYSTEILVVPTLNNFRVIFGPAQPIHLEPEYYGASDGFGQYERADVTGKDMGRLVVNSLVISTATVLIGLPLATMAAYVFSRYRFVGDTTLLIWVLITQFIPAIIVVIPFYTLFRQIGLLGTHIGVIIVNLSIVMPYAIWMIKGFVDAMPTEIEEAAVVDGCNEIQVLMRITVPLIAPGVIVAAVFSFIMAWNEFLFALTLGRDTARTLQIGLTTTEGIAGVQWEQMSAVGVVVLVPIFILSLLIRKNFVKGLTMGAVK
jgi:multiple sugar transport system permease protein